MFRKMLEDWKYECSGFQTAQKMKFSIKDLFSFRRKLQIRSHLVKKSLMENFIFCAVSFANI